MSAINRWLNWTPSQPEIIETSPKREPTKPSKVSFVGFDGLVSTENQIIHGVEPGPPSPPEAPATPDRHPSKVTKGQAALCPYALPEGVTLVRYTVKAPPVSVTAPSVVIDIPKFITHALAELDVRLHHPVQIKAGDSVFQLLSKLADCGLQLRLEWEAATQITNESAKTEPTKPSILADELNARDIDITVEDISS